MPEKIKYVDLALVSLEDVTDTESILLTQRHSLLYLDHLSNNIEKRVVRYCGAEKSFSRDNVAYEFVKGKNSKYTLHLALFNRLRKYRPDTILIHSFLFPVQMILLRFFLGNKVKIMILNHAEQPYKFPKIILQRIAEKFIDIYFLNSFEQANNWIEKKVFSSLGKIREIMEGSTFFSYESKIKSKKLIHAKAATVFLWCGSLNANKDPLTILNAFAKYNKYYQSSCLYMIYNSIELLDEVKQHIAENKIEDKVVLLGRLPHDELEKYYQAADYFILGSHREGSGFSLCEAMACGCIPIVTAIPSFKKMTNNGDCGFLFQPDDETELYHILMSLDVCDKEKLIDKVLDKFEKDLSFKSIALILEREISENK